MGPVLAILGLLLVVLVGLYALGSLGDDETPADNGRARATPTPTPKKKSSRKQAQTPAAPSQVSLRLVATGPVYVCLVDAAGKQVIDEQTLEAGTRTQTFKSRLFRTNFGNDNVRMLVNGKSFSVAPSADPIGYVVRPGRAPRRLSNAARPDCSA
jgi:hypothetical protein